MEILIIGGIVVLIMVFISTQIKKSAARAFDREVVDTENFRIVKPEGFVYPMRDDSEYAFEAFSKEYGERNERNTWKAQIYIKVSEGLNFASVCENAKRGTTEVISEKIIEDAANGEKICLLETEKTENEIEFNEFRKIVESGNQEKTYDLRITVLKSYRNDLVGRIDEATGSFQLK